MRRGIRTLTLLVAALPLGAGAQRTRANDEPFHWSGAVESGHWVYLHNLNGDVRVEAGAGSKVEITAVKRWRRGDPDEVRISVRQVGSGRGDVLICALWTDESECDEDGLHTRRSGWWPRNHNNDTSVEFTVRLPAGVKVTATTVNGGVEIDGATSAVVASTVNGGVEARSSGGSVRARTVNGDIRVRAGALDDDRTEYTTVNGSITVELPATVNADLDMRTTNGSVSSDFPLTIEGTFSPRRLRATLGKGGPFIRLTTVNGSIRLRKA